MAIGNPKDRTVFSTGNEKKQSYHIPYAPCMVYLPTSGWFLNISKANVGKYSIHGAYGYHTILQICKKSASFWGLPKTEPPRSYTYTKTIMYLQKEGCNDYLTNRKKASKKNATQGAFPKNFSISYFDMSYWTFCMFFKVWLLHNGYGSRWIDGISGIENWSSIPWEFHDLMTTRPTPQTGT